MNKEDLIFLKELQKELVEQPNDGNASPVFWVIADYRWRLTEEGYGDRDVLMFNNDHETLVYDNEESVKDFVDDYIESRTLGLREAVDMFTSEELEKMLDCRSLSDIKDCVVFDDYELHQEEEEMYIVENTMFLTKREAKEYIAKYGYNHTSKVHTYAMTAVRSPQVEKLLKLLSSADWEKLGVTTRDSEPLKKEIKGLTVHEERG